MSGNTRDVQGSLGTPPELTLVRRKRKVDLVVDNSDRVAAVPVYSIIAGARCACVPRRVGMFRSAAAVSDVIASENNRRSTGKDGRT